MHSLMKIKNLKHYLVNLSKFAYRRFLLENKDLMAMQYLSPLSEVYLPWTSYAIRPSGLVTIINEIIINNRTNILECGGGISTIYIAKILKTRGGHLYTIEHDQNWLRELQQQLEKQDLACCVSLIAAPLEDCPYSFSQSDRSLWYSLDILKKALEGIEIDLLLVDGPPASQKKFQYVRYPAVPFLKQYFASDYGVILDDIDRSGEQKIARKWQEELNVNFKKYLLKGGIAIAHSQPKSMSLL